MKAKTTYKGIKRDKFRSKLIRKGIFIQLPYNYPNLEHENRLFRTVLDYALYDLISTNKKARLDSIKFFHPEYERFKEVCLFAGLDHLKVYHMTLYLLKKVFPDYLEKLYIYQKENTSIIELSSNLLGRNHRLAFS